MVLILFLSSGPILIHLDENFILQTQENIIGVIFFFNSRLSSNWG